MLVNSPSSSVVGLTNEVFPQAQSFVSPSPRPNIGSGTSPSSGDVPPGVQVCVVSPQRENRRPTEVSNILPQDKYISVRDDESTGTAENKMKIGKKKKAEYSLISPSMEKSYGDPPQSNPVSRSSSGSYKPSPSAASTLRTPPRKHEYSGIVDKLARNSFRSPAEVRSNVTTTHTAFRLVNQNVSFGQPKVQKYLVETNISTVSTLLSEGDGLPQGAANRISKQKKAHQDNSPRSVFERMGALKVEDDRVQFV